MSGDERDWIQNAIEICERVKPGIYVLLVRRQDNNDEADVVVTNAPAEILAWIGRPLEVNEE